MTYNDNVDWTNACTLCGHSESLAATIINSVVGSCISLRETSQSGMKTCDNELCSMKEMAAIKIQSWARGTSCRRTVLLLEESLAAVIINTFVRSYISRRKMSRYGVEQDFSWG